MARGFSVGLWSSAFTLSVYDAATLPAAPGVYAIYEGDDLVYIGSSDNLRRRLKAHAWSGRWGWVERPARVKFSPTQFGWRSRERRLVKRLTPPGNRQWHPVNGKRRRLRRVGGRLLFVTGREALQIESDRRRNA